MDIHKAFHNVLTVVTKPIKAGKSVEIFWPFKELAITDIEDTKGNCGCTKPDVHADGVRATYNDGHKSKDIDGAKVVSKSVTVYLKDDKPLKVPNKKGVLDYNPDKSSIALTFHVTVVP